MGCPEHGNVFDLAERETRLLHDIRGSSLSVSRGTLWITQQNDTRDFVLQAGDCWVADRDGLTIVEAQEDATVVVHGGAPGTWRAAAAIGSRALRWLDRLHRTAQAIPATPSRHTAPYY